MKSPASKTYKPGSANFESCFLKFTKDEIKVRPSGKQLFFYGIFAFVGIFLATVPLYAQTDSNDAAWSVVFFGLVFFSMGAGAITFALRRRYPQIDFYERNFYPAGRDRRQ